MSRSQILWRQDDADERLFAPLLRFAYAKRIHAIEHGKVITAWDLFAKELFESVVPFNSNAPVNGANIRKQYDKRMLRTLVGTVESQLPT